MSSNLIALFLNAATFTADLVCANLTASRLAHHYGVLVGNDAMPLNHFDLRCQKRGGSVNSRD